MTPIARGPRVGLLGGSFNPPHLAHLALGRTARQALALDELRWLPVGNPWQKAGLALAAPEHRLAMLAALLADEPGSVVDDRELRRAGPSYTLDTVRALQAERPEVAEWHLVIGQDQYARFDTWHGWQELLARVSLAVAAREGLTQVAPPPALANHPHRLQVLPLPRLDISASAVRRRCAAGEDVRDMVGEAVAGYIARHQLYTGAC